MTTPYRSLFVETDQVRAGAGHCPWCHAAVQFVTADRMAVCEACGATFATSIALVTEGRESDPGASKPAASKPPPSKFFWMMRRAWGPKRLSFVEELALRSMLLGWVLLYVMIRGACRG